MFKLFKRTSLIVLAMVMISSLSYSQDDMKVDPSSHEHHEKKSMEPSGVAVEDGMLYGKAYDGTLTIMSFSDLMSNPQDLDGKVVLVKGSVADVCQKMGCWMTISDGTNTVRVITQHEFLLPKDIAGREAVVAGQFNITELSEEAARHYNDESKNPAVKTEDIKGSQKGFEIQATGIKILNQVTDSAPSSDPVSK